MRVPAGDIFLSPGLLSFFTSRRWQASVISIVQRTIATSLLAPFFFYSSLLCVLSLFRPFFTTWCPTVFPEKAMQSCPGRFFFLVSFSDLVGTAVLLMETGPLVHLLPGRSMLLFLCRLIPFSLHRAVRPPKYDVLAFLRPTDTGAAGGNDFYFFLLADYFFRCREPWRLFLSSQRNSRSPQFNFLSAIGCGSGPQQSPLLHCCF